MLTYLYVRYALGQALPVRGTSAVIPQNFPPATSVTLSKFSVCLLEGSRGSLAKVPAVPAIVTIRAGAAHRLSGQSVTNGLADEGRRKFIYSIPVRVLSVFGCCLIISKKPSLRRA